MRRRLNKLATDRALARVAAGETRYSAAKAEGLALSTVYRAAKREQQREKKTRHKK
jgi:hypothetical protein